MDVKSLFTEQTQIGAVSIEMIDVGFRLREFDHVKCATGRINAISIPQRWLGGIQREEYKTFEGT